jgi:hypothetical protein
MSYRLKADPLQMSVPLFERAGPSGEERCSECGRHYSELPGEAFLMVDASAPPICSRCLRERNRPAEGA